MLTTQQIRDQISHTTDGPVTAFVLMSRAAHIVKAGADPERAANALYEELWERGFVKEEDEADIAV